jgi:hypothetical protein
VPPYYLCRSDLPAHCRGASAIGTSTNAEIIRHSKGGLFATTGACCLAHGCRRRNWLGTRRSAYGPSRYNNLSAFSFNGSTAGKQSADALSAGSYSMGGPVAQAPPLQEQKNSPLTGMRQQTADLQSQNQLFSQQVIAPRSLSEPKSKRRATQRKPDR